MSQAQCYSWQYIATCYNSEPFIGRMLLILPLKLLDRVRNEIRLRHYSIRTIQDLPSKCIYKYDHINY